MTLLLTDLNVCQRKLRNFFNQLEQSNDQSSPIKEQQRNYVDKLERLKCSVQPED